MNRLCYELRTEVSEKNALPEVRRLRLVMIERMKSVIEKDELDLLSSR